MVMNFDYLHPDCLPFTFQLSKLWVFFAVLIILVFVQHQECGRFCFSAAKAYMQTSYHKTKRKKGLLAHDKIIRGTHNILFLEEV